MKVYVDLVFLLNMYLDFLLLLTTSLTLKRNAKLKRIFFGALVGSLSLIFLFWNIQKFWLFLFKFSIALLMNIATFGWKDLKYTANNLTYFYMLGIILGGFLYYLNIEFSYTHIGLIFIKKGLNIPMIFLLLISPIIFLIYYRQTKQMKANYNLYYTVKIAVDKEKQITLNGFLDTGNKLIDPITNKPIILISKDSLDAKNLSIYYVPFHSLNNHNFLKCFKPLYIEINKKQYKNYLVGISDKKFHIDGVKCLLNNKLMEEL